MLLLDAVALVSIVAHASIVAQASGETGKCVDVTHPGPRFGICQGTTMPFRACVPDGTTLEVFTKEMAYEMTLIVDRGLKRDPWFKREPCFYIMDRVATVCPGRPRPDICNVGGAYCHKKIMTYTQARSCSRDELENCTLPPPVLVAAGSALQRKIPPRLPCCDSMQIELSKYCEPASTHDWTTAVNIGMPCMPAPARGRP